MSIDDQWQSVSIFGDSKKVTKKLKNSLKGYNLIGLA